MPWLGNSAVKQMNQTLESNNAAIQTTFLETEMKNKQNNKQKNKSNRNKTQNQNETNKPQHTKPQNPKTPKPRVGHELERWKEMMMQIYQDTMRKSLACGGDEFAVLCRVRFK